MRSALRTLARRLLGVTRVPTYYLPWLARPDLECVVLVNNLEARFTRGHDATGLDATVTQHDAEGRVVAVHHVALVAARTLGKSGSRGTLVTASSSSTPRTSMPASTWRW